MRRQCDILGIEEVQALREGLDFRLPQYRREVFLRFYQFHLENRSHPGCVYYAMPWLAKEFKFDAAQKYWMAFINGNTQNIVTTWLIIKRFPDPWSRKGLKEWFNENYDKLEWDTDRRYHKKDFLKAVDCYCSLVGESQRDYFGDLCKETEEQNFDALWEALRRDFYSFGRLSSFSYAEYLRIIGLNIDCSTLFLDDMEGSKSHRNGLAKVLGRDDRDWHKSLTFDGKYLPGEIGWLKTEARKLRDEARARYKKSNTVPQRDVGYFTLESALCTYKSWHRENRRYGNVYNDMFHNRIRRAQAFFGKKEVGLFWDCREDCTPKHLLLELCPNDPGLCKEKQNYYRNTGHVIMMSKRWPEFVNPFDDKIWRDL